MAVRVAMAAVLLCALSLLGGCGESMPTIGEIDGSSGSDGSGSKAGSETARTLRVVLTAGDPVQRQDFLFVFDDSASMSDEVSTVQGELQNFFSALSSRRNVDYRVAVATTNATYDQGRLYRSQAGLDVLSPATPNVVSEFRSILDRIQDNIRNANSRPWSGLEMGLLSAELAIRGAGTRLRPGVPLGVVILSDATDGSRLCGTDFFGPWCDPVYSTTRFVDYFRSLSKKVLLYPLAAERGDECSSLEDDQAEWQAWGRRYHQTQSALGTGFTGSICPAGLRNDLNAIGRQISDRGICYDLPEGASVLVEVKVAGQPISAHPDSGYQLDSATKSLCFRGTYQPVAGAEIVIDYRLFP